VDLPWVHPLSFLSEVRGEFTLVRGLNWSLYEGVK